MRFNESSYMESKGDVFNKFSESLQNMDGRLHILDHHVPIEQQIEYLLYSYFVRKRRRKKLNESDYNKFLEKLESVELLKEEKKKILSILASSSEIRAYRLLEQYAKNPDVELVHWASMALMESRIAIETELSGEKQIFISTGLGGKDGKLRFYVLLLSSQKSPFADYQGRIIEKEFEYILPKYDCEIERLSIESNYVELVILLPFTVNIKKVLETVILECNQYGNFLSTMLTVTNVKELNQDEVNQVLRDFWKS